MADNRAGERRWKSSWRTSRTPPGWCGASAVSTRPSGCAITPRCSCRVWLRGSSQRRVTMSNELPTLEDFVSLADLAAYLGVAPETVVRLHGLRHIKLGRSRV